MEQKKSYTIKNKGTKALFENPILERLTRTHIAIPLTLFGLYSAAMIYYGLSQELVSVGQVVGLFFLGLLTFTLVEYIMHRKVFHLVPNSPFKEKVAYAIHGVHHEYPRDKMRLAMPPILSLILATGFFFLFKLLMGDAAYAFTPGFLVGYAAYLWVHYSVHAFQPPKNLFKILWTHHGIHHYRQPNRAFGVSSPFWDVIFRTMPLK